MAEETQTERKRGGPTEKMVESAKKAAERHGVALPKGFDTDFDTCKGFLDVYLSKPTPKALSFAESIAKDKGLELPEVARNSAKDLSAWIDANK
ncbi:metal ABC transporter permease [Novimethylophilus kurashikiensis]|uniref:Metal ABC transporter permease n=1 Tax=Novimethylophilus kurashikiensis TaxID=1825523 RepID=A0A2R5F869_9PROT|nr:hypothetical protein [Novimethylophilus kurashikiensis]GBG14416.1 metal ABC transporter permease [Novimethylophilus kurashikiensis]